jgi:separase
MFMRCIKAASYSGIDHRNVDSADSPIMQRLNSIVDRVTYLGACELLKPPKDISARFIPGVEQLEPAVLGAILERQVASLEASSWKEGVPAIIHSLLDDTLPIYNPDNMPIRRTRVLLKSLEASYYSDAALYKAPEEIGEEIRLLLTRQHHAQDESLTSNILPYRASACFWLALHAHKRSGERQTADIKAHTEAACVALKVHLSAPSVADADDPAPKQEPATKTTKRPATRSGRTTPPRKTSARRAAPTAPLKTTRSRSAKPVAIASETSTQKGQITVANFLIIFLLFCIVTADNEKATLPNSSQAAPRFKVDNSDKFLALARTSLQHIATFG